MESLNWKTEYKQNLYYNKYKYHVTLLYKDIKLTQYSRSLVDFLESQKSLRRFRQGNFAPNVEPTALEKFIHWKISNKGKVMLRSSGSVNKLFLLTNDLDLINQLHSFLPVTDPIQLNTDIPINTKYFKRQPKYNYRAYFKFGRLDLASVRKFEELLDKHQHRCNKRNHHSSFGAPKTIYNYSNRYVEYNEETLNTVIMLSYDDIIAKIYKCEKIPS
jgi:hypothetical protein